MATKPKIGAITPPPVTRQGTSSIPEELLNEMHEALKSGTEWVSDNVAYTGDPDVGNGSGRAEAASTCSKYRRGVRKLMGLPNNSKRFRVRVFGNDNDGWYFSLGLRTEEQAAKLEATASERAAEKEQNESPESE